MHVLAVEAGLVSAVWHALVQSLACFSSVSGML
jgi:hypothetical protein